MPPAPDAAPFRRLVRVAVVAEALLTLMDALIKLLSARYPVLQIAFLRYAFGLVGAAIYADWSRPGWPTRRKHARPRPRPHRGRAAGAGRLCEAGLGRADRDAECLPRCPGLARLRARRRSCWARC
jgi:hypothetical protein